MVRTVSVTGLVLHRETLSLDRKKEELEHGKIRLEFWKTGRGSIVEAALGRG